jgi:hypothetical protein
MRRKRTLNQIVAWWDQAGIELPASFRCFFGFSNPTLFGIETAIRVKIILHNQACEQSPLLPRRKIAIAFYSQ